MQVQIKLKNKLSSNMHIRGLLRNKMKINMNLIQKYKQKNKQDEQ